MNNQTVKAHNYRFKTKFLLVSLLFFILLTAPILTHSQDAISSGEETEQVTKVDRSFLGKVWCFAKTVFSFGEQCNSSIIVSDKASNPTLPKTEKEEELVIDETVSTSTASTTLVATVLGTSTKAKTEASEIIPSTKIIKETPIYNSNYYITNEYITNPVTVEREVVTETVVEKNKTNNKKYYNDDLVTKELLYLQTDSTHDSIGDIVSDLNEEVSTDLLTVTGNGTVSGTLGVTGVLSSSAYVSAPYFKTTDTTATSTFSGALTVGTTTDNAKLTLDGVAYLADVTAPGVTSNRLYSVGGSLYWAGSLVGGGSVGNWTTDGTHAWRAAGNVGIGTTSPAARLSVAGTDVEVNIGGYFGVGYGAISLNGTIGSNTYNFLSGNSVTDNSLYINRPSGGNINFKENNGISQMVISSGGNVGIGTTTPTHKLTVAGSIGPESDDAYNLGSAGSDWGCLYYDGGTQGICASDKRLKDNIQTLSFSNNDGTALQKLSSLNIATFNFKNAPNSTYTGLIAQEVLETAPELVTTGTDGYYRVKYGDIQWLTLEAVQELDERTKLFAELTSALVSSTSSSRLSNSEVKTFWSKLTNLATSFVDGVLTLTGANIDNLESKVVKTENIEVGEKLCINDTCVTEDQLKALLGIEENVSENNSRDKSNESSSKETVLNSSDDSELEVDILNITENDLASSSNEKVVDEVTSETKSEEIIKSPEDENDKAIETELDLEESEEPLLEAEEETKEEVFASLDFQTETEE